MDFEKLFISEERPSVRDKYISRVFGIFSEEIIRIWCENDDSPYINLGRPTVYDTNYNHYTLDFLLQDRNGANFLSEMKCEIEYQNYKNLTLNSPDLLIRHKKKKAFELFIEIASTPEKYKVKCGGNEINVNGSILVWGRVTQKGVKLTKAEYSLKDIISTESVISDLIKWNDPNYKKLIQNYKTWSNQLFVGLS